jgi:predicted phosphodiesterase
MRVAAIYDIHGNLPALEAVLRDVQQAAVGQVVVGGDVIPGPMPREVIAALEDIEIPVHFLRGNDEREVLAQLEGVSGGNVPEHLREIMRWVGEQLTAEQTEWLAGWPQTLHLAVPGVGRVLFCHATPRSDTEILTRLTSEDRLLPIFEGVDATLVVCGHTHMQFDRTVGSVRVVNAGSVGMVFGPPGAYWLLLGPTPELRRTPYDLRAAADRIRVTAYPQAAEFAERNILQPPSEAEMLEVLEGGVPGGRT